MTPKRTGSGQRNGSRVNVSGPFRFSRREKVTRSEDFRRAMKSGRRLSSKNFVCYLFRKRDADHRLGIIVKKEVGPATYRNRIKRYCREFFRLHKHTIHGSFDIILFVKKGCAIRRYQEAEKELGRLLTPGRP